MCCEAEIVRMAGRHSAERSDAGSVGGTSTMSRRPLVTLDQLVDPSLHKYQPLTSPRSIRACRMLGIDFEIDFIPKPLAEFLADPKGGANLGPRRYDRYESRRQRLLQEASVVRQQIIDADSQKKQQQQQQSEGSRSIATPAAAPKPSATPSDPPTRSVTPTGSAEDISSPVPNAQPHLSTGASKQLSSAQRERQIQLRRDVIQEMELEKYTYLRDRSEARTAAASTRRAVSTTRHRQVLSEVTTRLQAAKSRREQMEAVLYGATSKSGSVKRDMAARQPVGPTVAVTANQREIVVVPQEPQEIASEPAVPANKQPVDRAEEVRKRRERIEALLQAQREQQKPRRIASPAPPQRLPREKHADPSAAVPLTSSSSSPNEANKKVDQAERVKQRMEALRRYEEEKLAEEQRRLDEQAQKAKLNRQRANQSKGHPSSSSDVFREHQRANRGKLEEAERARNERAQEEREMARRRALTNAEWARELQVEENREKAFEHQDNVQRRRRAQEYLISLQRGESPGR